MSEDMKKLEQQELDEVASGAKQDWIHDKRNFAPRTVCVPSGSYLIMQLNPRGKFLPVKYRNGDTILIHTTYREGNWLFAYSYEKAKYGYVDGQYVR